MIKLSQLFNNQRLTVSIEIFPPKTADGDSALRKNLSQLVTHRPGFVSCTYGAGGSTRDRTLAWCREIQGDFQTPAMAHFTCVGSTREELLDWLEAAKSAGIRNIMALRGDPPAGQESFRPVPGGLRNANELVALIRSAFPEMNIGVAGYPEKHIEAGSLAEDMQYLKQKVDAGADAVFTQLFFVNSNFLSFRDECSRLGIQVPVIPGIMPITDFARIKRITSMCGTVFPVDLAARLESAQNDAQAQFEIGVEHAIAQCQELIQEGVPGIHFYALNKSDAVQRILNGLNC